MKITTKDIQEAFVREYFKAPKVARKMTSKDTTEEQLIVIAHEDIKAGDMVVIL